MTIMPRKSEGFILVTVLSLLLIISLLAISAAETSIIARRQTNAQWQFWQNRQVAIQAQQQITQTILAGSIPACIQAYTIDNSYWDAETSIHNSCHFRYDNSQGNSIIEALPLAVCDSHYRAANFYRVTTIAQANDGTHFHLQSIIAVPAHTKTTCQDGAIPLSFGLQSWRME
jgi:Tfp pilus assembly protein PilX